VGNSLESTVGNHRITSAVAVIRIEVTETIVEELAARGTFLIKVTGSNPQ
jgi:hypothetical protein